MTAAARAASRWLDERGLSPVDADWRVEIHLHVRENALSFLALTIAAHEWSIIFRHEGQTSWLRIADAAVVHTYDDLDLLAIVPDLSQVDGLFRTLEQRHGLTFERLRATVRSTIPRAAPIVRAWLVALDTRIEDRRA